jgi:formylglycine-generating enzyme required for sulfatase activity/serine/threonine protein kinase
MPRNLDPGVRMSITLEKISKSLSATGLLSAVELRELLISLPASVQSSADVTLAGDEINAEAVARELVARGKFNEYQASVVSQGKQQRMVFGEYTVLGVIGAGGMGEVYRAQHRRMERIVALKVLPAATTRNAEVIRRFHQEVKAAAKLMHTNIVTAHDAGEQDDIHYLVMEYVDGRDLSSMVKHRGPLPLAEALGYILQTARGLDYAHSRGIIHRDIKPGNLLVDQEGTVKILDMGLARFDEIGGAATERTTEHLTQTGQIMGTVDFMSPEQAEDARRADHRADIYSLGCTLFYLLTAKSTYGGETVMQKIFAHRDDPLPSLSAARSDVSPEINAIFQRMIAKHPDDRYMTMRAVVDDLVACGVSEQDCFKAAQSAAGEFPVAGPRSVTQCAPAPGSSPASSPSNGPRSKTQRGPLVAATVLLPGVDSALRQDTLGFHVGQSTSPSMAPQLQPAATTPALWKNRGLLIGGGVAVLLLGVALWAVVQFRYSTPNGVLVVKIDHPDVQVFVDDEQKMILSRPNDDIIEVQVPDGNHVLKVTKGGFQTYTTAFSVKSGGRKIIEVELEQKPVKPAAVAKNDVTTPAGEKPVEPAKVTPNVATLPPPAVVTPPPTTVASVTPPPAVLPPEKTMPAKNTLPETKPERSDPPLPNVEPLPSPIASATSPRTATVPVVTTSKVGDLETNIVTPAPIIAPFAPDEARLQQKIWADFLDRPIEEKNSLGMKLVLIPAGNFIMGSPDNELSRQKNEGPMHQVRITKPFYLGAYEVTQDEYLKVMGTNPSSLGGQAAGGQAAPATTGEAGQPAANAPAAAASQYPVDNISWEDAAEFCRKLNALAAEREAGRYYRLPTEAEWEYSCRAGTTTPYYTGKALPINGAQFTDKMATRVPSFQQNDPLNPQGRSDPANAQQDATRTAPVGSFAPNAFGIHDMHGNVFEWCEDTYSQGYYGRSSLVDPQGPDPGNYRVLRGGGCQSFALYCRSAYRNYGPATTPNRTNGFRVVCEP